MRRPPLLVVQHRGMDNPPRHFHSSLYEAAMRGHNPDWANLPRRKCDDCGKNYKPKQPLREGTRGFCSDNCRKSYHKHGGAYRKLKVEMKRMVEREMTTMREAQAEAFARFDERWEQLQNLCASSQPARGNLAALGTFNATWPRK
jgi:hypothetical protein